MSSKISNCFFEKLTFDKMLKAYVRARRNKKIKKEIFMFELNLENNIVNLINMIKEEKYKIGQYREFIIKDPKERIIKALPFIDHIVHQWYIEEFIKPYIIPRFIKDTYACIEGRGTHKAVDTLQKYMRIIKRNNNNYYILKCDIKKFFYTINKNILFRIMTKYIRDKKILSFTKLLIFSGSKSNEVGIPIGNYTSQFFANIYLHQLDMYIKHELRVKYYVRYMDDFVLLLNSKERAKVIKKKIEIFIKKELNLELNRKSRYYPNTIGINFCGYRIFHTHRLLRNNSKKNIKQKVKKWNKLYQTNKLNIKKASLSFNSWLGHAKHCNSYNFRKKVINACQFYIS